MIRLLLIGLLAFAAYQLVPGLSDAFDRAKDVATAEVDSDCEKPAGVQRIVFSERKYPHIAAHFRAAKKDGWPVKLRIERDRSDDRRDRLMETQPSPPEGYDRDEYPPAVGRIGWRADVKLVPSSENRSHGSKLGAKLSEFCDGTHFRYVFR